MELANVDDIKAVTCMSSVPVSSSAFFRLLQSLRLSLYIVHFSLVAVSFTLLA